MSKRVHKQKKGATAGPSSEPSKRWSVADKKNLLKALKTYGHEDYHKISEMLQNKSDSSVKLMIHKLKQKARSEIVTAHNERSSLDSWLHSGLFDNNNLPIPQALKFISLLEDHPKPEECNGFDFRAAYDYLYRTTLGHPMLHLNPETARKLDELMQEVHQEVWPSGQSDVLDYLARIHKKKDMKCYPPMSKVESKRSKVPEHK